ncbi:MAG: hypothetical protein QOI98_584 [Solirubrobacteraceae bacterium]|jgi:hypothetical protein|nr:hypothetical protein [Solirubrobacteraceae bacterium]
MTGRRVFGLMLAGLLGVAASLLVACGGGNAKLIPGSSANALQSDLDAVANAVAAGRCAAATSALNSVRSDFKHLPVTVDPALRQRLAEGIALLQGRALTECKTNTQTTKTTPTTTETTTTPTTTTETVTTPTVTVPPTTTTPTTTTPPTSTTPPTTTTGTGGVVVPTGTVPATTPEPQK